MRRDDTKVFLNAKSAYPSGAKSQILHRICVALLIKHNIVEYVEGDFVSARSLKTETDKQPEKLVARTRKDAKYNRRTVDCVIERHNAVPVLDKLFPNDDALLDRLKREWKGGTDSTWQCQYPIGFLADELKSCLLESGYQVGFFLPNGSQADLQLAVQDLLNRLRLHMSPEIQQWINSFSTNVAIASWSRGQQFSLSLEDCDITLFRGG